MKSDTAPSPSESQLPLISNLQVADWTRALTAVFEDALGEVRFPGVDAKRLRQLVDGVDTQVLEVARARAQLEAAQRALSESHELLEFTARQAHAYATVFAASDATLSEALAAAAPTTPAGGRGKARKKRRKRAAPRVTEGDTTEAPSENSAAAAASSGSRRDTRAA